MPDVALRHFPGAVPGQQPRPVESRVKLHGRPEPIRRRDLVPVAGLLETAPQLAPPLHASPALGGHRSTVRPPVPAGFGDAGHGLGLHLSLNPFDRTVEERSHGLQEQAASCHRSRRPGVV